MLGHHFEMGYAIKVLLRGLPFPNYTFYFNMMVETVDCLALRGHAYKSVDFQIEYCYVTVISMDIIKLYIIRCS